MSEDGAPGPVPANGRPAPHPSRSGELAKRSVGSPLLFTVVYSSIASAIYFALGVVAGHALGLTPLVFLIAAGMYALTAMTYVEAASLHQERGGSTVFARHAFNELVSFAAGWAIVLDYTLLIAATAYTATQYAGTFWAPLAERGPALSIALCIIALVVGLNIRGFSPRRTLRVGFLLACDLVLQVVIVVIGLVLFLEPHKILATIHLGSAPTWSGLLFAATITVVAFTSLESASGLAGEVRVGRRGLKRLVASTTATVAFVYVGIAIVAISALPVHDGRTALGGRYRDAPMIGVVEQMHPRWLQQVMLYTVAALAVATLIAAANSAMLGLSRLGYSLSTNRQIPTVLGSLHPRRSTPFVVIGLAGLAAAGLVIPLNLELLIGAYAFGAMLAFTIAHLSVIRMRFTEPTRDRVYRIPVSVPVGGARLPLPAVLGAVASFAGLLVVLWVHPTARDVGLGWMAVGLILYLVYRKVSGLPLLAKVSVPESMLVRDHPVGHEYGSVLVPLTGTDLDDDIMQTAALLASSEQTDSAAIDNATIEALWINVIPMALPLDAGLPAEQLRHGRSVLARAKAIGEEYSGVQVATAMVRTRRAGYAIVDEAKRRGVEAIVLGADEPSKIRGGSMLGGIGGPREIALGEVAKYVMAKAECRVIITAPAARDGDARPAAEPAEGRRESSKVPQ